jgi:hypothetical protein
MLSSNPIADLIENVMLSSNPIANLIEILCPFLGSHNINLIENI